MPIKAFRTALLILAACVLGWKAVAFALAQTGAPAGVVASVASDQPIEILYQAQGEFNAGNGHLSKETYSRIAGVAQRAPLEAEPFLYFGARAAAQGDSSRAVRLLEAARYRDPRLLSARLLLLDQYLRTRKINAAIGEMRALYHLDLATGPAVAKGLMQLVAIPALRDKTIATVRSDPALHDALLAELVAGKASPEFILQVAGNIRRAPGAQSPAWQSALVNSLLDRGALHQAAYLWARFDGVDPRNLSLVYDGEFKGLPGKPPFNWALGSDDAGTTERSPQGGLSVTYYGRRAGVFATQLLLLQPGSYVLAFTANGSADGKESHLAWQISCFKPHVSLLDLPLDSVTGTPRGFSAGFTVPATDCDGQWLTLVGLMGDTSDEQSARIAGLRVVRRSQVR